MGGVKELYLESLERGWDAPDKSVCAACVEDAYLKNLIKHKASQYRCDYCGKKSGKPIATEMDAVLNCVYRALRYYYCEPNSAGVPYESGWVVEPITTEDALDAIGLAGHASLIDDIVAAIHDDAWVPAADGHWATSHESDVLKGVWDRFSMTVKHRIRYFFMERGPKNPDDREERSPAELLTTISSMAEKLQLIRRVPKGVTLFRCRTRDRGAKWPVDAENMLAPPSDRASAGRMNPAGIAYLYLAMESPTAVAEIATRPPTHLAIAEFRATQGLRVLDLTQLPKTPSVFDDGKRSERETIVFLEHFVTSITTPFAKDGREHFEYVPSQVVCEYFAKAFRGHNGDIRLDGIRYPSAVRPNSRNLVLFPPRSSRPFTDVVRFVSGRKQRFGTWKELTKFMS